MSCDALGNNCSGNNGNWTGSFAKLELLPVVGSDLTKPFIAAAGGQDDRVRLLNSVPNGCKQMP
jgi:hypothetical protein